MTPLRSWALPVTVLMTALACDKADEGGRAPPPPPPSATAKPGVCVGGGGTVGDVISAPFFPRAEGAFCVDPRGDVTTFGEGGKLDLEAVCTMAFDGECAVYNQFGLKRLVSLRYVDDAGEGSTVDVYLSRFADPSGAYAMFTKRVVADADPAEPTTPRPLAAGAAGAIGTGRAYVWKGAYLAELQYNNEQETPEALARSSAKALASLGAAIGAKLPGPADLPPAVATLPADHRIVNGVQLVLKDGLGVAGLGPLAIGYYAEGPTRYRLVAVAGDDRARESWKLLKARPGALPGVGGAGDETIAVALPPGPSGGPPREYVFARKRGLVVGAGDEDLAAPAPDKAPVARLSKDEKVARLKVWLATLSGAASSPADSKK